MKLRKILYWILFLLIGFNVFNYVKVHTQGEVIAYKKFAKAMMKGDRYIMRNNSNEELTNKVMAKQEQRLKAYEDVDVVFTYYRIKDRRVSEDGKIAVLVGEQVSRVNPIGYNTLWGETTIEVRQNVTLRLHNDAWKIQDFEDPSMFQE